MVVCLSVYPASHLKSAGIGTSALHDPEQNNADWKGMDGSMDKLVLLGVLLQNRRLFLSD